MKTNSEDNSNNKPAFFRSIFIITFVFAACHEPAKKNTQALPVAADSSVRPQTMVIKPPPAKKKYKLYLTFDDSPNRGTRNVMSIVKEENIPASFFTVGEHVFGSDVQHATWDSLLTMQQIVICNHSYTHAWHNHFQKFYKNPDAVIKDFMRTQDSLHLKNNIVRAPGRNSWRMDSVNFTDIKKSKTAIDAVRKARWIVMGWDLEWHYDPVTLQLQNSADELLKQIDNIFHGGKTKIPGNLVLLAHDQVYQIKANFAELKILIQKLKQNNEYELSLVTSYPGINKTIADSSKSKNFR